MIRKLFPVMLLALTLAVSCGANSEETGKTEASTAQASQAVTALSSYDLAANQGKVVFVELWGVWCPPCIRSMPHVQKTWEKYKVQDDFRLMVVNTGWRGDTPDKVKGWLKQNGQYSFPVFFDDRPASNQFAVANEVNSIPRSLIFDKKGELRYNGHPMQVPATLLDELLAETI